MAKPQRKGAEEARNQLPLLLADAENGRTTIITRHGRSVAALVPVKDVALLKQKSIVALAGSGKGLWGKDSLATLKQLRGEWKK